MARRAVEEHGQKARERERVTTVTETREPIDPDIERRNADALRAHDPNQSSDDRDRQVMEGGPGTGLDAPPPGFSFSYNGRDFKTQEEVTSYIDDLQKQRQAAPVVETKPIAKVEEPPARKRPGDTIDFDKELYTDPKKVFSQFRDEIRQEIKDELKGEYQADQVLSNFWSSFYGENKDMKGKELLVNAVFNQSLKEIGDLPIPKAREMLADKVREEVLKISGERPRSDGNSAARNRTLVESGSGPASRQGRDRNAEEPAIPRSLSALIRARQNQRRQSQQPQQKAS